MADQFSVVPPVQQVPVSIVVADRGFVYVGRATVDERNNVLIREAKCIRVWGTTEGLAQLALQGPQSKTILDKAGTVRIPSHAVMHTIECDQSKWGS